MCVICTADTGVFNCWVKNSDYFLSPTGFCNKGNINAHIQSYLTTEPTFTVEGIPITWYLFRFCYNLSNFFTLDATHVYQPESYGTSYILPSPPSTPSHIPFHRPSPTFNIFSTHKIEFACKWTHRIPFLLYLTVIPIFTIQISEVSDSMNQIWIKWLLRDKNRILPRYRYFGKC